MSRWVRNRLRFLLAALILSALYSGDASAQSLDDCFDQDGEARECTLSEELASCLLDAYDAFEQCMGFGEEEDDDVPKTRLGAALETAVYMARLAACELEWAVNNIACGLETPFRLILD